MRKGLCPCNSGKLFKNCCLRQIQSLALPHSECIPFLEFPFAVQFFAELSLVPHGIKYVPLFSATKRAEAGGLGECGTELHRSQYFQIGLCNNEIRPLVQVRTNAGVFECLSQDVLPPGNYEIIATFDARAEKLKLYAEGRLIGEDRLSGSLSFANQNEPIRFALGLGSHIWFCQAIRGTADFTQVVNYGVFEPTDLKKWNQMHGGVDRVFQPDEFGGLVYCFLSNTFLNRVRSERLEDRILNSIGVDPKRLTDSGAVRALAFQTMSEVTDRLQAIIENPNSTEPDLLKFFKENPAAAFLLEPDLVRQWREEAIQHYGQIDFVFELVDGTYRVVEIESPSRQIFTMANEFSQQAQHAMEQSRKWVRGASKSPNAI